MVLIEISRAILLALEKTDGGMTLDGLLKYAVPEKYAPEYVFDVLSTSIRAGHIVYEYTRAGLVLKITPDGRRFIDGIRSEERFELLLDIREKLKHFFETEG